MTITTSPRPNGVDAATLFATLDAVKETPEIAKFQFRATSTWLGGTHTRSEFCDFFGAMQEMEHKTVTVVDERPPRGAGRDRQGPHAGGVPPARHRRLLDRRIANIASARGVTLTTSAPPSRATRTSSASSDSPTEARNGYQQVKVAFHIEGDADDATLREIVEQSRRRSAVYDG